MATTEIYTLSLHDALPIYAVRCEVQDAPGRRFAAERVFGRGAAGEDEGLGSREPRDRGHFAARGGEGIGSGGDRKSTRLNSSHDQISYAVFCLKKKKK